MRKNLLSHVRRIVVKVGSGVISGPDGLDEAILAALTRDLAD